MLTESSKIIIHFAFVCGGKHRNRWFICVKGSIRLNRSNFSLWIIRLAHEIVYANACEISNVKLKWLYLRQPDPNDHCIFTVFRIFIVIVIECCHCRVMSCYVMKFNIGKMWNTLDQFNSDWSSQRASLSMRLFIFIACKKCLLNTNNLPSMCSAQR